MSLTNEKIQENKERFISLLNEAATLNEKKAPGIKRLLDYLETSNFYVSPASTKYHQSYEGGLCEHCLNVYDNLMKLMSDYGFTDKISRYSAIIVSLLHDMCKVNYYKKDFKWIPKVDENGREILKANGKPEWDKKESWTHIDDPIDLGHAPKSIYMIQHFFMLSDVEATAIMSHMGMFDVGEYYSRVNLTNTWKKNKLAYLLHWADMNDVYMNEEDTEQ